MRKLGYRGDTIVEVLIVLAVLGLSFAIASATAGKGLSQSRNAEEHSEALGVMSTQLELLRVANMQKVDIFQPGTFCLAAGPSYNAFGAGFALPSTRAADQLTGYPGSCVQKGLYYTSVQYNSAGYFTVRVRWEANSGTLGGQEERAYYRVRQLTDTNQTIPVNSTQGQISVRARLIHPASDTDVPTCSSTDFTHVSNASTNTINAVLRNLDGGEADRNGLVDSNSTATFTGLKDNSSYVSTLTSYPAGYTVCPPNPSVQRTITVANPTQTIDMYIVPGVWVANGSSYASCTAAEALINDGRDSCQPSGANPYAFAYRNIALKYNIGINTSQSGNGYLVINYNQYAASVPPPSYSFHISYRIGNGAVGNINLPVNSDTSSYTARSTATAVAIPAGATQLSLTWDNNSNPSGYDANFQINSVQLYYR